MDPTAYEGNRKIVENLYRSRGIGREIFKWGVSASELGLVADFSHPDGERLVSISVHHLSNFIFSIRTPLHDIGCTVRAVVCIMHLYPQVLNNDSRKCASVKYV